MLVEAANNRHIAIAVLDNNNSPAKQVNGTNPGVDGSFSDPQAIRKLAQKCDILTVEIEHVNTHVLEILEREAQAQGTQFDVQPSWQAIRTIQDKFLQKVTLLEGNVDGTESIQIPHSSLEGLQKAGDSLGFPFMLKSRTGAYDGKGNHPIKSMKDFEAALKALKNRPLYAEKWVDFTKELAVMVVKTKEVAGTNDWDSSTLSYPTVETVHEDSICKLVYAPARGISAETNQNAQQLARRAVASFKGKGIFGVEMFLLKDNRILVNEIAPRPHNSGHYTMEACRLSQYDTHLLAILDRPISAKALKLLKPSIMLNVLGGADPKSYLELANAADAIGAKVHLYGKGKATKGRKMGHITILGDSMDEAENEIRSLVAIADEIRRESGPRKEAQRPEPLVAVITGSESDQPYLKACYGIFDKFGIPFEKRILSAHRTADEMTTFAKQADGRGIKVIIAAAGGAAHLPGMIAANTSVLVIGLPIKPTVGDGMDSLLSMTNMPRGCPVATVGINNSTNAALTSARILAGWDKAIKAKLEDYIGNARRDSLNNDRILQDEHSV
jgi:phosphoribosylaminoimidazole carboxylase